MGIDKPLNIFYEEPEADRWLKYDRYPRRLVRRIVRGEQKPGGVMLIAINLMRGLDKLRIPYRFNDYRYIRAHPKEIACIIGKPHLLFDKKWSNPVILGAGVYSHPIDRPDIFDRYPNLKCILVPGNWMQKMFEPYYEDKVKSWAVGIDVENWAPAGIDEKNNFLIYDKVRWEHEKYHEDLIDPIINVLKKNKLTFEFIRYGNYTTDRLKDKLSHSKAAIFLCEHETQGQAYQQILATNTPILAWDRGGYWQDPYYYPHKVKYEPVSSVPYWDDRCGIKFADANEFEKKLIPFLNSLDSYQPRDYIMENLTLEKCAEKYLSIYQQVEKELK